MLRSSARGFVDKECPTTLVRQIEDSESGYSPELWKKMAALGWMGLAIPGEYEGTGGSFLDLVLLIEEMGRGCLSGPFLSTVAVAAMAIAAAGTERQKQELLPQIARGEKILTLALTEPGGGWDADSIRISANAMNDYYVISGTKLFVEDVSITDYVLCVARTNNDDGSENGITVFLLNTASLGLKYSSFNTIGGTQQYEVVFDSVVVPATNIIGEPDNGRTVVRHMLDWGAIAKCAEMIGAARQVVDMTVAHAKERIAYERPIASFQVVQHLCVDMLTYVDTSRNITYEAAWRLSEELPCAQQVAAAKAWTNEAYVRITKMGTHLHGAIGFTRDHDIGLYYRRAKAAQLAFGDSDYHLEVMARELGL